MTVTNQKVPCTTWSKIRHSNKAESIEINSTDSLIPNTDDLSSLQYGDIIAHTKSQTMDLT